MEKVVGEKELALQHQFRYKSSKFSDIQNCRVNLLFGDRSLKFGHFGIFDARFSFLASLKLWTMI